jgi:2-polyprenyl-3-methyl-5-hydroxy-6-metoxy-1,4-benzoquinol methylase
MIMTPADRDPVRAAVAARYAGLARSAQQGRAVTGCGTDPPAAGDLGPAGYSDTGGLPEGAVRASLGCGNPVAVADLRPGETVLDLGCGGGIDVLLSARRVGPSGRAYGLDMTTEMLDLAREHARQAGAGNAESFAEYCAGLAGAGFAAITITATHQVADGLHSAIIRAARP